jgi:ABC-type sugar transport system ATPase subunit
MKIGDNMDSLLVMEQITKEFPGVKALSDVTLRVREKSILGLVGENGAGKSTLMKILSGHYTDYKGSINWKGNKVLFHNEKDALDLGIAIVPQELNPIPDLTIAENIFIGREPLVKFNIVARKLMYKTAEDLLKQVCLNYPPDTKVRDLSVAEKQMLEIIKAISRNAKLIIMDEPTSALTPIEIHRLFEQVRRLRNSGISIIYISHKLEEIFEICDEVTVLRDGKIIGTNSISELDFSKIIKMMVGRTMDELYPPVGSHAETVRLSIRNLCRGRWFRDINFDLKAGEILGIAGIIGAGRSEVVRVIFGLDEKENGEIILDGKPISIRSTNDAIKNGIAMVAEDRAMYGFVGVRSIRDNILLPNTDMYSSRVFIHDKEIDSAATDVCRKLEVKAPGIMTPMVNLSGGNQQKIVLGKWILRDIKVLIMDEPTRGIDVGSKYEIYKIMTNLSAQGISIIMISSELTEVIGMSHRILVMSSGKIVGEMSRNDVTQEKIMQVIVRGSQNG